MYIHEAIAARTEKRRCITRESWQNFAGFGPNGKTLFRTPIWIRPTTSPDRCIVESNASGQTAGWQPTMDDLIADDWKVV